MHEIQISPVAEAVQIRLDSLNRELGLESQERIEAKGGVIEIATAGAVFETAIFILLTAKKGLQQIGGVTEELGRQAGDLEHFKAQTHEGVKGNQ